MRSVKEIRCYDMGDPSVDGIMGVLHDKNFINDRKFTCKAFIEGIPDDILLGKKEDCKEGGR